MKKKLFESDYREMFQPFIDVYGDKGTAWNLMRLLRADTTMKVKELFPPSEIAEPVFNYFKTVVIPHKINVLVEGRFLLDKISENYTGPLIQEVSNLLYIHDLSKFSLEEAIGYCFHDFKSEEVDNPFERAWHHHKMNNPHHPEYWINPNREGVPEPISMPTKYVIEMVADWMGAGKTYGKSIEEWLPGNLHKFLFHRETLGRLSSVLAHLDIICEIDVDDHRLYFDKIAKP
jgi:hypothetical protein